MAYCAVSGMTNADWLEIKKLCKEIREYVDSKIDELDDNTLQTLQEQLNALQNKMTAAEIKLTAHDKQLESLEQTSANKELTTQEVIEIYEGV